MAVLRPLTNPAGLPAQLKAGAEHFVQEADGSIATYIGPLGGGAPVKVSGGASGAFPVLLNLFVEGADSELLTSTSDVVTGFRQDPVALVNGEIVLQPGYSAIGTISPYYDTDFAAVKMVEIAYIAGKCSCAFNLQSVADMTTSASITVWLQKD